MRSLLLPVMIASLTPWAIARAEPAIGPSVEVRSEVQARLGIETTQLASRTEPGVVRAYARVLDVAPLAALDAEMATAGAAATASQREVERLTGLAAMDQGASQQAVEAARATAAADGARHSLAERRLALEWGHGLASLSSQERGRLVDDVAQARAALIRIDPLADPGEQIASVQIAVADSSSPPSAELLGPAPTADARLQATGLIAVVRGAAAQILRPGRVLEATVITMRQFTGVVLPRSSLVRMNGATWAWVRESPERFVRREVTPARLLEDGWLVTTGFQVDDTVVEQGAGALLAIELGAQMDEDD